MLKTVLAAALLCALAAPAMARDPRCDGSARQTCMTPSGETVRGVFHRWPKGDPPIDWAKTRSPIVSPQVNVAVVEAKAGRASWYGGKLHHGSRMANGEIFDQESDSCAHRSLPFGTRLRVTRGERSVQCVVRDRGPFVEGRIVDLSRAAARALDMLGAGVAAVTLERVR